MKNVKRIQLSIDARHNIASEWLQVHDKVAVSRREYEVLLKLRDLVMAIDDAWGDPP